VVLQKQRVVFQRPVVEIIVVVVVVMVGVAIMDMGEAGAESVVGEGTTVTISFARKLA